jgi:hypothetical protein
VDAEQLCSVLALPKGRYHVVCQTLAHPLVLAVARKPYSWQWTTADVVLQRLNVRGFSCLRSPDLTSTS